jgi:1-aminocyclopropane-1-carboxylate deaminase
MKLLYWNREKYRNGFSDETLQSLKEELGDFYFIPEGGTNDLAVRGTSEIIKEIDIPFDFICSAVGTGGTIAGLIKGKRTFNYHVIGFSALNNSGFLEEAVEDLIGKDYCNWIINNEYSFGGYAKFTNELINFINKFYVQHNIELDPIYTGKMMFGLLDLIGKGFFKPGSVIIALHTGGLQGKIGFNKRYKNILL